MKVVPIHCGMCLNNKPTSIGVFDLEASYWMPTIGKSFNTIPSQVDIRNTSCFPLKQSF